MPKSGTYGSERGAVSNGCPYLTGLKAPVGSRGEAHGLDKLGALPLNPTKGRRPLETGTIR